MADEIPILSDDFTDIDEEALGIIDPQRIARLTGVSSDVVAENVSRVIVSLGKALEKIPQSSAGFTISEVQVALAINGKGAVSLIGQLETGVTASLSLKLVRCGEGK